MVKPSKSAKGWNKCSKCGKNRTFNNKQLKVGRDLSKIGNSLICNYCFEKLVNKVTEKEI